MRSDKGCVVRIAIMQPYIFPYMGYFQLISAVDCFVIYDNIQYTKRGWINRNRILQNGKPEYITLPLEKASDYLNVDQRNISADFNKEKLIRKIEASYKKAPYFDEVMPKISDIIKYSENNLFDFLQNSIMELVSIMGITTPIIKSSILDIDHRLKSEEKVIAICKELNACTYINPIGGIELYSQKSFADKDIKLNFLKSELIEYKQFGGNFVPNLSIIDVLMFNKKSDMKNKCFNGYKILTSEV